MGPPGNRIGDHGAPVSLPKLKKAYEKGTRGISWGPLLTPGPRAVPEIPNGQSAPALVATCEALQGRTDNSWGPRTIGDHGAPVSLPKLKTAYEKGTRSISWGPLLTPGPWAVPEFPNDQSAP
ncbi:unnamed protein product, partial [Staurois parvus]